MGISKIQPDGGTGYASANPSVSTGGGFYGGLGTLSLANPSVNAGSGNGTGGQIGGLPQDLFTSPQYGPPLSSTPVGKPFSPVANQQNPVAQQPAVPDQPIQGGRQWFNQQDAGTQQNIQNQFLGGDSDYQAQLGQYNKALQDFVGRIAQQNKQYGQDADDATAATNRNRTLNMNDLGQDFGARGMSYSGLFDQTKNMQNERYDNAVSGIGKILAKQTSDNAGRQADYTAENQISQQNAARAALMRMAAQQSLIQPGA